MFLSAYESIQACQMMEELLGQVMAKLLEAQIHEETKLWSSIALCQSRSKYARKEQCREEKQSEENRGQQLQSSCALLEYFPKSIFYILYTISKLRKSRIQRFKPCTIWSWNEEVTAFERWLLQAEGRIQQSVAKSAFCCKNFVAFLHSAMELLLKLPDICATLEAEHLKMKDHFAALREEPVAAKWFRSPFVCLRNLANTIFSCEMVLSASRYLPPTLLDIFLQIFLYKFPFFSL